MMMTVPSIAVWAECFGCCGRSEADLRTEIASGDRALRVEAEASRLQDASAALRPGGEEPPPTPA